MDTAINRWRKINNLKIKPNLVRQTEKTKKNEKIIKQKQYQKIKIQKQL